MTGLPPVAVYAVVGILAGIENIFPPVPADTAVALGAFLSHGGSVSALTVFFVTWSANVASASAVYVAARTLGRRFFQGRLGRRLMHPARLAWLERSYRRYGVWGVFLSRFVPGVRAVVPPFAGIAELGAVRALLPVALASAIWYGTLTYLVARLARQLTDVALLLDRVNRVALIGALMMAVGALGAVWWHRRRGRA